MHQRRTYNARKIKEEENAEEETLKILVQFSRIIKELMKKSFKRQKR
jgi:hypothetical protein